MKFNFFVMQTKRLVVNLFLLLIKTILIADVWPGYQTLLKIIDGVLSIKCLTPKGFSFDRSSNVLNYNDLSSTQRAISLKCSFVIF